MELKKNGEEEKNEEAIEDKDKEEIKEVE